MIIVRHTIYQQVLTCSKDSMGERLCKQ